MSLQTTVDFLEPINLFELSNDEGYKDTQLGRHIALYDEVFPDVTVADIVLVGCGEMRGAGIENNSIHSPNAIRHEFYSLYHWHKDIQVADVGNVKYAPLHIDGEPRDTNAEFVIEILRNAFELIQPD